MCLRACVCVSWTSRPRPLMSSSVLLLQQTSVLSMTSLLWTPSVRVNCRTSYAERPSSGETHTQQTSEAVGELLSLSLSVCRLTVDDRRLLWDRKSFCQAESSVLPLVLASAPCWQWSCLPEIYALLRQWSCPGHLDSLGLLHASYVHQSIVVVSGWTSDGLSTGSQIRRSDGWPSSGWSPCPTQSCWTFCLSLSR